MKAPKITKCPACSVEPQPSRDGREELGLWCEECGFNATIADIMHADYLVGFYPGLSVRTTAERIRNRQPLIHSLGKIA